MTTFDITSDYVVVEFNDGLWNWKRFTFDNVEVISGDFPMVTKEILVKFAKNVNKDVNDFRISD